MLEAHPTGITTKMPPGIAKRLLGEEGGVGKMRPPCRTLQEPLSWRLPAQGLEL